MRSPAKDIILSADSFSGRLLVLPLDLSEFETIEPAVFKGAKRFGQINVLINNAAYGLYSVFEAIPRESVKVQFDVNVFGTMNVTRAVLPHLRANSNGGGVKERQRCLACEESMQNCLKKFSSMEGAIAMSSEDVAELICEAVTDGKKQLRYFIGPDHLGTIKAKYESSTDEQYTEYIRTKVFDV
ncbi:hypothetical protein BDZ89DRAFT_1143922 [Hymenopellis radicata]|nr:hypothetical protein BDZ89DRAFT_1143922 [Hymenopellis radicata]